MYRRYSYTGAGPTPLPTHHPPPLPPPPAASPLPFPGAAPQRYLSSAALGGTPSPPQPRIALGAVSASPSASVADEATAAAAADEQQLQSMLSALRVALGKKEAALVCVAARLADVQGQLESNEAERRSLVAQMRELELTAGAAALDSLPAATSVTAEGKLLAQARHELGQEAARAAELEAERDALQLDVALLQQQLTTAAQVEAQERERLGTEATQCRLLARARARQVEQLQAELQQVSGTRTSAGATASQQAEAALAEAAAAKAATADASARAAAAEAAAAQLRQQLTEAHETGSQAATRCALQWQCFGCFCHTELLLRVTSFRPQRLHPQGCWSGGGAGGGAAAGGVAGAAYRRAGARVQRGPADAQV